MLVLFETSAGYAIFKVVNEKKLDEIDNLYEYFESPETASKVVKLKQFELFKDTTDALAATASAVEGKMGKKLKKILKKLVTKDANEQLAVADAKLGSLIKEKFGLTCVSNSSITELMRCIRSQADSLLTGLKEREMTQMALGLAHGLSRYKLKFSPDKIDTMIVHAVSLLDDLDKELNNYTMRCREWYGWHFPELGKVITDNVAFVRTIKSVGMRTNFGASDLSEILPEEVEAKCKEVAEISMGVEISDEDMENIIELCDQIIDMTAYREQLYEYLRSRMMAIAPNLSVLVGDLVGARLIAHAGSLLNLAKHPASTVQILGAEKALFRSLKTKHNTPKYGLLYHAQLVGQTGTALKGKIARMLAAKSSLACRVDALGEDVNNELGMEHKAKLEMRLKLLQEGGMRRISGTGKQKAKFEKYDNKSQVFQYPNGADSTIQSGKKRKFEELNDSTTDDSSHTKKLKDEAADADESFKSTGSEKKKKKKNKDQSMNTSSAEPAEEEDKSMGSEKKKKKKAKKQDQDQSMDTSAVADESLDTSFKKKKKSKNQDQSMDTSAVADESLDTSFKKKKKSKKQDQDQSMDTSAVADESLDTSIKKKKKKKKHEKAEDE